jgi:hypothetical protein
VAPAGTMKPPASENGINIVYGNSIGINILFIQFPNRNIIIDAKPFAEKMQEFWCFTYILLDIVFINFPYLGNFIPPI